MRVNIVLGLAVVLAAVCSLQSAEAGVVEVVTLKADRDLGLYAIESAPVGAPGILGTNRGLGGRMDFSGTATNNGDPTDPTIWTPGGPGQNGLMSFDLSSLSLQPGDSIASAELNIYRLGAGYGFDVDLVAYPLREAWSEGNGTTGGVSGSTGFPWGPTQVGDTVRSFRVVDTVVPGEGIWGGNGFDAAATGVAWDLPGALRVGSDMVNRKMFTQRRTQGFANQADGESMFSGSDGRFPAENGLEFSQDGLDVLTDWENGTLANNGLNLFFETDYGDPRIGSSTGAGSSWRATTRENSSGESSPGVPNVAGWAAPDLVIEIHRVPEPATLVLLGASLLCVGFTSRRNR